MDFLRSATHKVKTPCGNLYITAARDEVKPIRISLHMGKAGGCVSSQMELVSRLITLLLQNSQLTMIDIQKEISGMNCHLSNEAQLSCANAIAKALKTLEENSHAHEGQASCRDTDPDCEATPAAATSAEGGH